MWQTQPPWKSERAVNSAEQFHKHDEEMMEEDRIIFIFAFHAYRHAAWAVVYVLV